MSSDIFGIRTKSKNRNYFNISIENYFQAEHKIVEINLSFHLLDFYYDDFDSCLITLFYANWNFWVSLSRNRCALKNTRKQSCHRRLNSWGTDHCTPGESASCGHRLNERAQYIWYSERYHLLCCIHTTRFY